MACKCRVDLSKTRIELIHKVNGTYTIDTGIWEAGNNLLERAEAVIVFALAAATCYSKTELETPVTLVVCCLDGR